MRLLIMLVFLLGTNYAFSQRKNIDKILSEDSVILCNINCNITCFAPNQMYCDSVAYWNGEWKPTVENKIVLTKKDQELLIGMLNNDTSYMYSIKKGKNMIIGGGDLASYIPTVALIIIRNRHVEQYIFDPLSKKYRYFKSENGKQIEYAKHYKTVNYYWIDNTLNDIFMRNNLKCYSKN